MTTHIANFIFDNGTYFAAHLGNGGVRIGMNGYCAIDLPAGHALHAEATEVTEETAEAFIDAQIEAGRIRLA